MLGKERSAMPWKVMRRFHTLLLTFLFVSISSAITYIASLMFPWLNDILVASPRTPWGIVTSLFIHLEVQHLAVNMVGLLAFLLLFVTSNISLLKEEIRRRIFFLLIVVFLAATISNLFWIILIPHVNTTGSSGLVFASEGVTMGFALLNSLKLRDIAKCNLEKKKSLLAICAYNATVFIVFFLQIILAPELFLGVAPRVNVFVHGIAFYISFSLTVLCFSTLPWFRARKKQPNLVGYAPSRQI